MFNGNCSTALTMPVMPANYGYGNNGGMFGGYGSDIWAILILFALFGGWGGNGGFGFGGGNRDCATQADVRAAVDQQTLISKIDAQTYGLSDVFNSLNTNLNNNFRGIDNAICTLGYNTQQGFNNLGSQLAMCCCDIERGIDGVNYNLSTQSCDTRRAIADSTRDIIENANCNTRSILDFLVNDKISTLTAENQSLKLKASQAEQNAYLVNELRPCPVPAYITCNPYASSYGLSYGSNGCGCGCGSF